MRVVVLGAGVIGVTSAYYLAKAGHEVTLVERRPGPAQETSFANAGEISPGYASPWAAPDVPRKALKWLFMENAPLILRPRADPAMILWLLAMLRNCTATAYATNKSRMVRLAEYSRRRLELLRAETGIEYEQRMLGTLQLFRTQAQLDAVARDIEVLTSNGVPFELLDAAGCTRVEPGLASAQTRFVAGLRLPGDETGDCYKFTRALAGLAADLGVRLRYEERVVGLSMSGDRVASVKTDKAELTAEVFVVALGSRSPSLLKPVRLSLPVYPVKGYSITANVIDPETAPVSTLLDETYKVAITRLGDRIRVGGMAELSGFESGLPPKRRRTLTYSAASLFSGAGDWEGASFWSGLRPMTPDGTPVVGPTPIRNLFLNTGHGTLGWTMACGSGKVLADLVSGRVPDIEARDLELSRYRETVAGRAPGGAAADLDRAGAA